MVRNNCGACNMISPRTNKCPTYEKHNTALCSDPKWISNVGRLSLCQWTIYPLTSEGKTIPPSGLFQGPIVYSSAS